MVINATPAHDAKYSPTLIPPPLLGRCSSIVRNGLNSGCALGYICDNLYSPPVSEVKCASRFVALSPRVVVLSGCSVRSRLMNWRQG